MKQRNFFAVLWLACSLSLSAQTQQGYVKTLGRPNQQGRALSDVSIRVKGGHNAVLSGQDGTFAMPMPIAVPSSMRPRCAISTFVLFSKFRRTAWSTVMGHCV